MFRKSVCVKSVFWNKHNSTNSTNILCLKWSGLERFVNFWNDIMVINMAAEELCVTSSGIHCTLPFEDLPMFMKIILQRLITYQFWEWWILFFKAIARNVTFIKEFCSCSYFSYPSNFALFCF